MSVHPATYKLETPDQHKLILHRVAATGSLRDGPKSVLYIHGATFASALSVAFKFDGYSWMDDLSAAGFNIWALDFHGFGNSEHVLSDDISDTSALLPCQTAEATRQVGQAVAYIRDHDRVSRVSLIAHSWGTMPAGKFAGDYPEHIDRLVLFGPIAQRDGPADSTPAPAARRVSVEAQYQRFVEDVPAGHAPVLEQSSFARWSETYLDTDSASRLSNPFSVVIPGGPAADIHAAWNARLPYDPNRIIAPTLIVRGAWDSLCNNADAQWLFDSLGSCSIKRDVKISHATHLMHLETHRFELYEVTRTFLSSTDSDDKTQSSTAPPIAVIFEVYPAANKYEVYIALAAELRPELESIDGFISIERFSSLTEEGKILSLSFWRDEEAVECWRNRKSHRDTQSKGRAGVFDNYRLRVAGVIRDYGMLERDEAPRDSARLHDE